MAIADFTFDEMVYNNVVNGKVIYYNDTQKTINYVKLIKSTRQVQIHCIDGDVFLANQDDVFSFEVNFIKPNNTPTLPKLKGKNK